MKVPGFVLTLVAMTSPVAAQSAPRVAETLAPTELQALEAIRKDVWIHWFAGDTVALRRVLTPELVAIGPDSPAYQSLAESLAGSASYRASGGHLESVDFAETRVHRFGEVVVMFSHYTLVMTRAGVRTTQHGRATEVFVRRGGRWVHTSWHLDTVS